MPLIRLEMLEGRPVEKKQQLAEALTRVVIDHLGLKEHQIWVIIDEKSPENWATSGVLKALK